MLRQNSFGKRSKQGVDIQVILMVVFFTPEKRGHNPVKTVSEALTKWVKTGILPPPPGKIASVG